MDKAQHRKLLAILFADIVGYTSLMESDEARARQLLDKFHETLKDKTGRYRGQVVNNYGDGCLCSFDSAVDAVNCALEVQQFFQKEPKVPVRMGLHSGDVFFKDDNLFGDSVNVASRIESLGVAGAVLFSKRIKRHIANQNEFEFKSLGEFDFKNVDKTMEVFALTNDGLTVPKREELKGKLEAKKSFLQKNAWLGLLLLLALGAWYIFSNKLAKTPANSDQATITIFPFDIKGSSDVQYLGEAMVDLITTKLDGIPGINPVDPNRVFSQLNEGGISVRQLEKAARLSQDFGASGFVLGSIVELNERLQITASKYGKDGQFISKKTLEVNKTEISSLVDELTQTLIATELSQQGDDFNSVAALTSKNLPALKAYLLGEQAFRKANVTDAFNYYVQATELDSTFVMAWFRLWETTGWGPNLNYPGGVTKKIEAYRDKLPPKWREYAKIKASYSFSKNKGAIAAYQRLIKKYGETREFTNRIAEEIFHGNPAYGKPISEAKPWLIKARELDSNNQEALIHLMDVAAAEDDTLGLKQVLAEADSTSEYWTLYKIRVLCTQDNISEKEILEVVRHPLFQTYFLTLFLSVPENGLALAECSQKFIPYIENEAAKTIILRDLNALKGKEKRAYQLSKKVELINDPVFEFHNYRKHNLALPAYMMANRNFAPLSEEYQNLYGALKGNNSPWALFSSIKYCMALQKETECGELKNKLLGLTKGEPDQPTKRARFFYYSLLGFEAQMAEKPEDALRWIDSSYQYSPGGWPQHSAYLDKLFMLADIYQQKGEYEKSIGYLENIPILQGYAFVKGYTTYRLSELYELNGGDNQALAKCNLLIKDYQDCDTKYRPWVEEVTQRRDRLMAKLK